MKIAKLLKKPFYRTPVEATYVTKLDKEKRKKIDTLQIFLLKHSDTKKQNYEI